MPNVKTTIQLDTRALDNMSKYARKNAADVTLEETKEIIKDIRSSWSAISPSAPGQPPAYVTGNLDKSIPAPRQTGGGATPRYIMEVKAYYASFLEYGTVKMAARPFIRPALVRAEQRFGKRFKRVVEP